MQKLTRRQQEILEFIEFHSLEAGLPPTYREIATRFAFRSVNAARQHVLALVRKGALQEPGGKARSYLPTRSASAQSGMSVTRGRFLEIPVYGSIPAGFADGESGEAEGCLTVEVGTLGLRPSARTFALKVRGDSMIGRHVCDGDTVVCEHGVEPRDGQMVAALIDNESTLKTFVLRRGKPFLKAENPRYPDLIPAHDLVIQGVVTNVLRRVS